jgi:uncharacterized integral membrane protein
MVTDFNPCLLQTCKGGSNEPPGEISAMKSLKMYSFVILAVLALVIILQNIVEVPVRVLYLTMTAPLAVLLLMTLLVGMGLGMLIAYLVDRRARKRHA